MVMLSWWYPPLPKHGAFCHTGGMLQNPVLKGINIYAFHIQKQNGYFRIRWVWQESFHEHLLLRPTNEVAGK